MSYIDVFHTSDDGLRLYARDYPGPVADAPCVLCLAGLTRNSKDFAGLAAILNKEYRVICPDQRGRGRSAYDPQPERYRPERYAQDMLGLLGALGIKRTAIIGTSLGGLMAIMMMTRDANGIACAVLNDVGPEVDPRGVARIAAYVGKLAPVTNWEGAVQRTEDINGPAFPAFSDADWQAVAANTFRLEDGVPVADYDPAISKGVAEGTAAPNLWPFFQLLAEKPMMVIRGELSDILSSETLAEMGRRMPHVAKVQIEGVGHAPTLNEEKALTSIQQFLRKIM